MGADFHFLQKQDKISYEAEVFWDKNDEGWDEEKVKVYRTSLYFPETNEEVWRGPLNKDTRNLLKLWLGVKI